MLHNRSSPMLAYKPGCMTIELVRDRIQKHVCEEKNAANPVAQALRCRVHLQTREPVARSTPPERPPGGSRSRNLHSRSRWRHGSISMQLDWPSATPDGLATTPIS